jgi:hypothetical protein
MTRVVIESPLNGRDHLAIADNQAYALRAVIDCLRRGESPYASHLFFHRPELLDDLIPEQRTQGLLAGLTWAAQAEVCAVYLDRGLSDGMRVGIQQAVALGQRISLRWIDQISLETARQVALEIPDMSYVAAAGVPPAWLVLYSRPGMQNVHRDLSGNLTPRTAETPLPVEKSTGSASPYLGVGFAGRIPHGHPDQSHAAPARAADDLGWRVDLEGPRR